MAKIVKNQVKVILPNGAEGQIQEIDITELGFVKVKTYIPNEKRWVSYIMEDGLNTLVNGCNFKLIGDPVI